MSGFRQWLAFCIFIGVRIIPCHADLIIDQSGFALGGTITEILGFTGQSFTTPAGSSFVLDKVEIGFFVSGGYTGTTNVGIYGVSGSARTLIGSTVVTDISNTKSPGAGGFDFAIDKTVIGFSSQNITLDPNTQYSILAQHNGAGGNLGFVFASSGNVYAGGQIENGSSLSGISGSAGGGYDAPFTVSSVTIPEPGAFACMLLAWTGLGAMLGGWKWLGCRLYR